MDLKNLKMGFNKTKIKILNGFELKIDKIKLNCERGMRDYDPLSSMVFKNRTSLIFETPTVWRPPTVPPASSLWASNMHQRTANNNEQNHVHARGPISTGITHAHPPATTHHVYENLYASTFVFNQSSVVVRFLPTHKSHVVWTPVTAVSGSY